MAGVRILHAAPLHTLSTCVQFALDVYSTRTQFTARVTILRRCEMHSLLTKYSSEDAQLDAHDPVLCECWCFGGVCQDRNLLETSIALLVSTRPCLAGKACTLILSVVALSPTKVTLHASAILTCLELVEKAAGHRGHALGPRLQAARHAQA